MRALQKMQCQLRKLCIRQPLAEPRQPGYPGHVALGGCGAIPVRGAGDGVTPTHLGPGKVGLISLVSA